MIGNCTTRCQHNVEEEVKKYGDILQSDVSDDYNALPDKVLSAYQWIYYHINKVATFYSFTDDDCAINVLNIYKHFESNFYKLSDEQKVFCGFHLAKKQVPERYITQHTLITQPVFNL